MVIQCHNVTIESYTALLSSVQAELLQLMMLRLWCHPCPFTVLAALLMMMLVMVCLSSDKLPTVSVAAVC
jgi:hypothetical protein